MITERINEHLVGMKYADVIPKLEVFEDQGDCCGLASCEQKYTVKEGKLL